MKIILGCEESQTVCKAFRAKGHEAYSCDILAPSGGHPEWHFQDDIFNVLRGGQWDMGIFFPPCTHLAVSGAKHFAKKRADGRQQQGIDFFMAIANCGLKKMAIENPIGIMSGLWRKPDQIIQPWQFGDEAQKSTCLWLTGLTLLKPTNIVGKGEFYTSPKGRRLPSWYGDAVGASGKKIAYGSEEMKKVRSKTFNGIALAMADQWGSDTNLGSTQQDLFGNYITRY